MKRFGIAIVVIVITLSGCSLLPSKSVALTLGKIPYTWSIPTELASHLTVEIPTNEFAVQAQELGAQAQAIVYYTPDKGERVSFMGAFYFPSNTYYAINRSDEPPAFGSKVIEDKAMILSAWGPQDSIFDPTTQDGKNISELYNYVYDPKNFTPTHTWKSQPIVSILGCYGAALKADRFYLQITKQDGLKVEGKISLNNNMKDSSSGNFVGTFDGKTLNGMYRFMSEGVWSNRELFYRLTPKGFLSGFGPVEENGDTARFIRPLSLSWDESYIYSAQKFCK